MLMKPGTLRGLTEDECRLVLETFGPEINLERIRIMASRTIDATTKRAFCAGGMLLPGRSLMIYPARQARLDFGAADTPLYEQSVFIHEMTHVWQSQRGVKLLFAKLKAGDRPESYRYQLTESCCWDQFNIEQQAMIVQDDFLRRRGREVPHPEDLYCAVLPFQRHDLGERRLQA